MDRQLGEIIAQSARRLLDELEQTAPGLRAPLADWMRALAGGHAPEAYFQHPLAFPTLLLPWWVDQSLNRDPDLSFHADIVYSSINGYYFIRMIDNVMDGEGTVEKNLLPALAFFHTEFQTAYQKYFPPSHPFWELYRRVWFGTAQAAVQDASLDEITLETFERASAQKVSAALIPAAAVCHRAERPDLIAPWSEFVFRIGKWHQMFNDLFDWHKDSMNGNRTFFLSEARRLKGASESETAWIVREGFAYGCDLMRGWMGEAQDLADALNSPALAQYLHGRGGLFEERARASCEGLAALRKLARIPA
jgi:hypothetical protein